MACYAKGANVTATNSSQANYAYAGAFCGKNPKDIIASYATHHRHDLQWRRQETVIASSSAVIQRSKATKNLQTQAAVFRFFATLRMTRIAANKQK